MMKRSVTLQSLPIAKNLLNKQVNGNTRISCPIYTLGRGRKVLSRRICQVVKLRVFRHVNSNRYSDEKQANNQQKKQMNIYSIMHTGKGKYNCMYCMEIQLYFIGIRIDISCSVSRLKHMYEYINTTPGGMLYYHKGRGNVVSIPKIKRDYSPSSHLQMSTRPIDNTHHPHRPNFFLLFLFSSLLNRSR